MKFVRNWTFWKAVRQVCEDQKYQESTPSWFITSHVQSAEGADYAFHKTWVESLQLSIKYVILSAWCPWVLGILEELDIKLHST